MSNILSPEIKGRGWQFLVVLFSLICNISFAKDDSIFAHVMKSNLASVASHEDVWPDEEYYLYFDRCMKNQQNWQEYKKRQVVFQLFDKWAKKHRVPETTVCSDPVTWGDLNLFCGQSDLQSYFANKIDRTQTIFGRVTLLATLVQPTVDTQLLERRQKMIKYLVDHPELLHELDQALLAIRESENMFLSFWAKDELKEFANNYRYFQLPWNSLNKTVNRSEVVLTSMNAVMHYTNIVWVNSCILGATVMLPVSLLKLAGYKINDESMAVKISEDANDEQVGGFLIKILQKSVKKFVNDDSSSSKIISGLMAIGGVYSGLSIKEWFNWERAQFAVEACLHVRQIHVAKVVSALDKFKVAVNKHSAVNNLLTLAGKFNSFFDTSKNSKDVKNLKEYFIKLHHKSIPNYSKFASLAWYSLIKTLSLTKGRVFINYLLMNENKECFEDSLAAIGEIDMYVSLAKLYKENQHKKTQYSFVQFKEGATPSIELENFWNPFIDPSKVITNSLTLGLGSSPRNMIITGPNAGGKSTILKATAIAVIMAQSFGLAPCNKMIVTPFSKITTYLNIADDIGAGRSLFKAQALRAQKLLNELEAMKKGEFGFMIVDEMFNGTNPTEAEAAAYSVAKSLGEHPHGMCLIATHFPLLTQLGSETNSFANFNVSITHGLNGSINYPFKLCPGISDQHVAIEILRSQGFDGSILDNAEAIIRESREEDEENDDAQSPQNEYSMIDTSQSS
jgi:DNA mismatch repair protein MutS